MKKYQFESANMGTITVEITGESDEGKDLWVMTENDDATFDEIDGGSVELVMLWMLAHGVKFENARSFKFVSRYIASVMLDGDMTEADVLHDVGSKWDDCQAWMDELVDETSLTIAEAAHVIGVSRQRVQKLIDNGTIDAHLVGKRMKLVNARDVVEWATSDRKPGNPHKHAYEHDAWNGEGWYRIAFSDGGMDWTNEGPAWIETEGAWLDEMEAAKATETEFHLAYSEYLGDGDRPEK